VLLCLRATLAIRADMSGVVSVIDGDTLDMYGKRIRLYGIDALESTQRCHQSGTAPMALRSASSARACRPDRAPSGPV
jgi:endonuclease YncB( thermonuclease family)